MGPEKVALDAVLSIRAGMLLIAVADADSIIEGFNDFTRCVHGDTLLNHSD